MFWQLCHLGHLGGDQVHEHIPRIIIISWKHNRQKSTGNHGSAFVGLQTIAKLPQWRSTCLVKGAGLSDSKMMKRKTKKTLQNEDAVLVGLSLGLGLLSPQPNVNQWRERTLVGLLLLLLLLLQKHILRYPQDSLRETRMDGLKYIFLKTENPEIIPGIILS